MATCLERAPVAVTVPPITTEDETRKATVNRARRTIGYGYTEEPSPVYRLIPDLCLAELNIQPFTEKSVRAYMRRKFWGAIFRETGIPLAVLALSLICDRALIAADWPALLRFSLLGVCGIVSILALTVTICMLFTYQTWISVPLSMYGEPVPLEVLQRALALEAAYMDKTKAHSLQAEHIIHLRNDDARYQIAYLGHKEAEPVNADPFLVWTCHGRRYYIDAWDEPGFNQERVI